MVLLVCHGKPTEVALQFADEESCITKFVMLPIIGLCGHVNTVSIQAAAHLIAAGGGALGRHQARNRGRTTTHGRIGRYSQLGMSGRQQSSSEELR